MSGLIRASTSSTTLDDILVQPEIVLGIEPGTKETITAVEARFILDRNYEYLKQVADCTDIDQYIALKAEVGNGGASLEGMTPEQAEIQFHLDQAQAAIFVFHYEAVVGTPEESEEVKSKRFDSFYQNNPLELSFDEKGRVDEAKIDNWLANLSNTAPVYTGTDYVNALSKQFKIAKAEILRLMTNPFSMLKDAFVYAGYRLVGVHKINAMTPDQVANPAENSILHPNNIAKLSRLQIWFINRPTADKPSIFAHLNKEQVENLQKRHFNNNYFRTSASRNILNELAVDQIKNIKAEVFGQIHPALVANMDLVRFKELTEKQVGQMSRKQLARLDGNMIENLPFPGSVSGKALAGIDGINGRFGRSDDKFKAFVFRHAEKLTADQINSFHIGRWRPPFPRTAQIKFLAGALADPNIIKPDVFKNIEGRQLRKLSFPELVNIVQNRDIKDFTADQINALRVPGMVSGPKQGMIQAFGAKIAELDKPVLKGLAPKQLRAMAPEQFSAFIDTKHVEFFNEMTGDQLRALSPAALKNIPADVRTGFDPALVKLMNPMQRSAFSQGITPTPEQQTILDATPTYKKYFPTRMMNYALYGTFKYAIGVRTINRMSPEDVKNGAKTPGSPVSPEKISTWPGYKGAFVNNLVFQSMDKTQIGVLPAVQFNTIFRQPPNTLLQVLKPEQVALINKDVFSKIKLSRLALLDPDTIDPNGNKQAGRMSAITADQLSTLKAARFFPGSFLDPNPFNVWNRAQIQSLSLDAIPGIPVKVIQRTPAAKIAMFSAKQFNKMSSEQFKAISVAAIKKISSAKFSKMDLSHITYKQIRAISDRKIQKMTVKQLNKLAEITVKDMFGRSKSGIAAIKPELIKHIPVKNLNAKVSKFLAKLTGEQIAKMDVEQQINKLDPEAIKKFDPKALAKGLRLMKDEDFKKINADFFKHLTPAQARAFNSKVLNKMSDDQFKAFGANIKHLKTSTLNKFLSDPANVAKLDPKEHIPHLTVKQLNKLKPKAIQNLNIDQLHALTPAQLEGIKPKQMVEFKKALEKEIAALKDKLRKEFPNMSEEEIKAEMAKRYPRLAEIERTINAGASTYESNLDALMRMAGNIVNNPLTRGISNMLSMASNIRHLEQANIQRPLKLTDKEAAVKKFFADANNKPLDFKIRKIAKSLPNLPVAEITNLLTAHAQGEKDLKSKNPAAFAENAFKSFNDLKDKCAAKGLTDETKVVSLYMATAKQGNMSAAKMDAYIAQAAKGVDPSNESAMSKGVSAMMEQRKSASQASYAESRQRYVDQFAAALFAGQDRGSDKRAENDFSGEQHQATARTGPRPGGGSS